jgi:hypothetical protein
MATQFAFGKIVTNGLVLALDAADKNSYPGSGTTWRDMSGNNYSGSLTNGPTFSNNSIVFDGIDDYSTIGSRNGSSFTDTDNMTVSIFLKINNKNVSGILGRFSQSASSDGWTIWVYNNKLIFFNTNSSNAYDPNYNSTGYSFTDSKWFNFCVTRNSSTKELKWYVNGELNQEYITNNSTYLKTNNGISIGSLGTSYYMNGSVGTIKIYNRPLSPTEVAQNYNAQKSRFGIS